MQQTQSHLIIRPMTMDDIGAVVDIHRCCFSEKVSLFSALNRHLAWRLYARYVKELHSIGFVLVDSNNGTIAGYAAGTLKPGFHKRYLFRHFLCIIWHMFIGLLTKPAVWKILSKAFLSRDPFNAYRRDPVHYEGSCPSGPMGYFMPIAINPDYRGGGNAVRLARALIDYFFELGVARIRGNKIAIDNIASQKLFIEKLGWNSATIKDQCVIVWTDQNNIRSQQSKREGRDYQKDILRGDSEIVFREMVLEDIDVLAELYMKCFPHRINSALGKPFLRKFFLQALLEEKSTVVVAEHKEMKQIIAAASGSLIPGFTLRFIKQNRVFFIYRVVLSFFLHSEIRKKVFQKILYLKGRQATKSWPKIEAGTGENIPAGAHLNHLFVCVSPQWQKKGIAKKTLSCMMDTLFDLGADRIWGCVETTNIASMRLHKSLGWNSIQTSDKWNTIWADAPPNSRTRT